MAIWPSKFHTLDFLVPMYRQAKTHGMRQLVAARKGEWIQGTFSLKSLKWRKFFMLPWRDISEALGSVTEILAEYMSKYVDFPKEVSVRSVRCGRFLECVSLTQTLYLREPRKENMQSQKRGHCCGKNNTWFVEIYCFIFNAFN